MNIINIVLFALAVNLSPDQTITLGSPARISMTFKGAAGPVSYAWSSPQTGTHWRPVSLRADIGPAPAEAESGDLLLTGFVTQTWDVTFDKQGTYTLRVLAYDGVTRVFAQTVVQVKRR